jgi:hypothetical protein
MLEMFGPIVGNILEGTLVAAIPAIIVPLIAQPVPTPAHASPWSDRRDMSARVYRRSPNPVKVPSPRFRR